MCCRDTVCSVGGERSLLLLARLLRLAVTATRTIYLQHVQFAYSRPTIHTIYVHDSCSTPFTPQNAYVCIYRRMGMDMRVYNLNSRLRRLTVPPQGLV
jgi:hypothetical protein